MLSFIHSIKSYISQFESKVHPQFHLLRENQGTTIDKATIQVMLNCVGEENVYDVIGLYKDECIKEDDFSKNCLENLIHSLDSQTLANYKTCFKSKQSSIKKIQTELESDQNQNTHIMINKSTYHGTIKPENVFEAICGAFNVSPKSCLFLNNNYSVFMKFDSYKKRSNSFKYFVYWINLGVLLSLLSLAGIAIYLIYDKIYNRFMGEHLQKIVRESMSSYESIKNNE